MKILMSMLVLMFGLSAGSAYAESARDLLMDDNISAYSNLPADVYQRYHGDKNDQ
ncbi:hypothetical protein [Pontibacterium sp.]|uniref:hypothetical protein n=1 Tax=Pontibacterium sp. TaxID=2036026 RepID=UPI0035682280